MLAPPVSPRQQEALLALLDDESPVVRAAVRAEVARWGEAGLLWLREAMRHPNRMVAGAAKELLEELIGPDPVLAFREFIRSQRYELETGAILLARIARPSLEVGQVVTALDALAQRTRELTSLPSTPRERCRVINRVLFHEVGFRGDTETFDDPRNSSLADVIERKRGLPITLSILYLLVAQRCGLQLEPIGTPGRFLVGCFLDRRPFFIDPFARGLLRDTDEVYALLAAQDVPPRAEWLAPVPVREVLGRCCRNLARQHQQQGQLELAALYAGFLEEFAEVHRAAEEEGDRAESE